MAYRYFVNVPSRIALVRFRGTYTVEDGRDWTRVYFGSDEFAPDNSIVFDLSAVTRFDATFRTVSAMVNWKEPFFKQLSPDVQTVLVAPNDVAFGMARMYQQLAADKFGAQISVVRTEAEALVLLDLEDTCFDALEAEAAASTPPPARSATS